MKCDQFNVRLPINDHTKFKQLANKYGLSQGGAIRYIVHRCIITERIPGIKPIER